MENKFKDFNWIYLIQIFMLYFFSIDLLISYGLKNKHYYDFFEKNNNVGHVFKRKYLFRNQNILSENFQTSYYTDGYGSINVVKKTCPEKRSLRFLEEETFLEKSTIKYIIKKGSKKKKERLKGLKKPKKKR